MFHGNRETKEGIGNNLAEAIGKLRQVGTLLTQVAPWADGASRSLCMSVIETCDTNADKIRIQLDDLVKGFRESPTEQKDESR